MYAPHSITVYTITEDEVTFESVYNITILRGVFFDAAHAANVRESGLEGADVVNLFIPFNVNAIDGITGFPKRFATPKQYGAAEDKSNLWTLDTDSMQSSTTFFVKGEIVEQGKDFQWMNRIYDNVHRITKVDTKDFGSPSMQHWEVGGA